MVCDRIRNKIIIKEMGYAKLRVELCLSIVHE